MKFGHRCIFIHKKMNNALKKHGKTTIQEVYQQVESIVFSEETKTTRLKSLQNLKNYFENCITEDKLASLKTDLSEMLTSAGFGQEQADKL